MEHQRDGDPRGQPLDEVVVEVCSLLGHRVGQPDGDGERVDPGRGHEVCGLLGVGAYADCMGALWSVCLATDEAELRLGPHDSAAWAAITTSRVRARFSE